MSQSLHWSPKTITTLLINYTPIQNKKFEKKFFEALFLFIVHFSFLLSNKLYISIIFLLAPLDYKL